MWETFDINVLVNGNRCKQYHHNGGIYIEAKDGSEYSISIQNNYGQRVLAVCSVDGLNVLTGNKASTEDSGYIIDAYHTQKIKGFRFSDSEWALFKFGYKLNGKTYAQSKDDGSEKNCGVLGVRLFYEKQKPVPPSYQWQCNNIPALHSVSSSWNPSPGVPLLTNDNMVKYSGRLMSSGISSCVNNSYHSTTQDLYAFQGNTEKVKFDMGTEWGRREESKVQEVDFERAGQAFSLDIYYDSRQNLIDAGIPLTKNLKISSVPQSFPENKYAKPPKNWQG